MTKALAFNKSELSLVINQSQTKPEKRLIGYAQVSTQSQDLARQTKA